MKIWITLGKFPLSFCHKQDLKPLAKIHGRLTDLFASYSPKLLTGVVSGGHGYPTHELTVRSDDPLFERLIEQFRDEIKQSNPRIVGFFRATPEPEETKRARFIEQAARLHHVPGQVLRKACS